MIGSSQGASVLDWFSTFLMIVGFSMLLGLSAYLMTSLLHVDTHEPPDTFADIQPYAWHTDGSIAS